MDAKSVTTHFFVIVVGMRARAERLGAERLSEAIDVFCDAFGAYPVMRYVVGSHGDVDARMRRLTTLFVTRRFMRGGPLFGVANDGHLVGAAILTLPDEPGIAARGR